MRHLTWRQWLAIGLSLAAIPIFFVGREWKHRSDMKGQGAAERQTMECLVDTLRCRLGEHAL